MKIRIVSLAVCVMFLTGFVNASSVGICSTCENSIIYVDDDNTGGPWEGTIEHPYQYIQDAIDNASKGNTVFVFAGIYNEKVRVNKTINLAGEDRNITIIDEGIRVDAYYVNITGFTVQNGSWKSGGFYVISSYCKISGNIITNCGDGIALVEYTSFNVISGNIIIDNCRNGINNWFGLSNNNIIKGNIITNNWYTGISLSGENNNISDNLISKNDVGINIRGSNIKIYENNIRNNKREGINLVSSDGNYLFKNYINNNGCEGLILENSYNNIISGNAVTNNKNGISLTKNSNHNIIEFNTISDQHYGIWTVLSSNNNLISNNKFIKNNCGLYLSNSTKNNVSFNNFRKNILNAFFINCNKTLWYGNFWNRPRLLPKVIFGLKIFNGRLGIPCINLDNHPAKKFITYNKTRNNNILFHLIKLTF